MILNKKIFNNIIIFTIKLIVAISIVWLAFSQEVITTKTLITLLSNPSAFILTSGVILLIAFIGSARIWIISTAIKKKKIKYSEILDLHMIGLFITTFIPAFVITDLAKISMLVKKKINKKDSVFIILFDRVLLFTSFFSLTISILLPLLFEISLYFSFLIINSIVIFLGGFAGKIILKIKTNKLNNLKEYVLLLKINFKKIIILYVMSSISSLLLISIFFIISQTIEFPDISYINYLRSSAISVFANSLPISIGGIGVGEYFLNMSIKVITKQDHNFDFGSVFVYYRIVMMIFSLYGFFRILKVGLSIKGLLKN